MQKIFGVEKYQFYLTDVTTSIIYNNEGCKNKIINSISKDNFTLVDSKMLLSSILVKDYLRSNGFNMKLIPYYGLNEILQYRFNTLTFEDRIFLKIITSICNTSQKVVFDDVLTFLSVKQKCLVLKYLKDNNITFFNFTSDTEEVLYTKYLIVLSDQGVIVEGNTKSVLMEEKVLKHNGFNLPFVVDLSHQLKDYGLIDKEYYSIDKLVSDLWKD